MKRLFRPRHWLIFGICVVVLASGVAAASAERGRDRSVVVRLPTGRIGPGAGGRFGQAGPAASPVQGEPPAQRLASIVGVAVGEYGKGVDVRGTLVSAEERD